MSHPPAVSRFLDWIYPPVCALCQCPLREGCHLCCRCVARLGTLPANACLRCAQWFDGDIPPPESCPNCESLPLAFDFATAALRANDHALNLIHQFKLAGRPELGADLAQICARAFRQSKRLSGLDNPLLIPVPLHPARQRQRRFNQAVEIAKPLASELNLKTLMALKRVQNTPRQATLTRAQRRSNLRKSMQLRVSADLLQDQHLIIIDDVFTTGSTAHTCAQILRKAKPASLSVLTVVRA